MHVCGEGNEQREGVTEVNKKTKLDVKKLYLRVRRGELCTDIAVNLRMRRAESVLTQSRGDQRQLRRKGKMFRNRWQGRL